MKNKITLLKRELQYEVLLVPALIGYLIFFVYPVIGGFYFSLTNWSAYSREINFIGLENFRKLFHDSDILTGIRNTVIYSVMMTVFQNGLAIPLAVILNRNLKTRNLLRMIFFSPSVLSILVVGYLWSFMMSSSDYGLLNNILESLGLARVNWLGNPKIALYSIIITQVWQGCGWSMVIYLANLQSIPDDLYESAEIDGAGWFQQFLKITFPMLAPALTITCMIVMIGSFKVFDIVFAMTGGGPGHATETIGTILIQKGFTEGQYGYGSALGIVMFLFIAVISLIQLKYLKGREDKLQ
jgi:raffinose/stachyose/melibiose transport system permease protein